MPNHLSLFIGNDPMMRKNIIECFIKLSSKTEAEIAEKLTKPKRTNL